MNIYCVTYTLHGRYQYYEEEFLVVVAETSAVALGLALESKPKSHASDWAIVQISKTQRGAYDKWGEQKA